jgi:hypothetical protein
VHYLTRISTGFRSYSLRIFILALVILPGSQSCSQPGKNKPVKLKEWNAQQCDATYEPSRLVDRITNVTVQNGVTFLTVSFSDNCCAEFKPQIQFRDNALYLLPYKKYAGDYCDCDCCFSIQFAIEGLEGKQYETYFNGTKIKISNDHYSPVAPTYAIHDGDTINQTNRYGFKERLWMEFYDNGILKSLQQYPENNLYHDSGATWEKEFYSNGKLSFFSRKDTMEWWFEDGTMKRQILNYQRGDTTFRKEFSLFDNRTIEKRSFERDYPTIFRSELDPNYQAPGSRREVIYGEEYFENGIPKYRFGKDTIYNWYPSGRVESLEFNNRRVDYDENGDVKEWTFYWNTKGPAFWGDLKHILEASIGKNGRVSAVHYGRDETFKDGITSEHYEWEWSDEGKLLKQPEDWKEPVPWLKFKELDVPR